jgi:hypothetical protein
LNKFILSHIIIYIKQRNKKGVIKEKNVNLKEKNNKEGKKNLRGRNDLNKL